MPSNPDNRDKWLDDLRQGGALVTEAVRREAENELARLKLTKLDGLKDYEKAQRARSSKTARLRALRLAKEAEERANPPKRAAARKKAAT